MLLLIALIAPFLCGITAIFHALPKVTRPDLFFAVMVPAGFRDSEVGRRLLRRYHTIILSCTAVAIAVTAATGVLWAEVLIPGVGFTWAFVSSHARTLAYAAQPNPIVEVDLAPPERFPGGIVVALLPLAIMAGLGFWALEHLDRLPDRITVHWGLGGPDGWVATTPATVVGFLAVHATTCFLLLGIAWGLLHASRRVSTSGAAAAGERHFRRRMIQLLIVTEYLLLGPPVFALLVPNAPGMTVWGVALAAVIVIFAVSLFRAGQGGSRIAAPAGVSPVGDRTPDACWKWGMFYVNSADPSILVEKRFGIGYTVNFGNRWSWVVLLSALLPAAFGIILLR